jgi:hypothetical protein
MRAIRHVPFVLVAIGSVACTALLGDFSVGGGSSSGTVGDGGGGEGGQEGGGVLNVSPADTKVGVLRAQAFTATADVTWSVQEGNLGGSIDAAGKYLSPDKPGIFHVVATSKADPNVKSTAAVTVVPLGVNVVVGRLGGPGNIDGPISRARLRQPSGVGYMGGSINLMIVADTGNNTIRKVQNGTITTVAGNPGFNGTADGSGPAARFDRPAAVAVDENGKKVWVLDQTNSCVRKVDVDTGAVTTFAGKCGTAGHQDSTDNTGATALLGRMDTMVLGSQRDALYVCEIDTFRGIRRIDATTGRVTSPITGLNNSCTMAADYFNHTLSYNDNNNSNDIGRFADPVGGPAPSPPRTSICPTLPGNVAFAANAFNGMTADTGFGGANDIYVTAQQQPLIHKCNLGTNTWGATPFAGAVDDRRVVDGPLATARFARPTAITAYSPQGTLFLTDDNTVRRIQTNGATVSTVAGLPSNIERIDGPRTAARMTVPFAVTTDDAGNPIIADVGFDTTPNNTIRKFDNASAVLSTVSGAPYRYDPALPPADGPKDQVKFGIPWDLVRIGGDLFVVDFAGQAIRKVSLATGEAKTIAGELNVAGNSDGAGAVAHFKFLDPANVDGLGAGITTDGTNLYVTDGANFAVRKIVIATGTVSTLAGGTKGTANGKGAIAQFIAPSGIAFADGFLYVTDAGDHTIRKIDVATGEVTGFMGLSGQMGTVDGDASKATLSFPSRIVADGIGNLFFAEAPSPFIGFGVIRRIDLKNKAVLPFAGVRGQQGLATGPLPSTLNCPAGMSIAKNGDLYVTDSCDGVLAVISPL